MLSHNMCGRPILVSALLVHPLCEERLEILLCVGDNSYQTAMPLMWFFNYFYINIVPVSHWLNELRDKDEWTDSIHEGFSPTTNFPFTGNLGPHVPDKVKLPSDFYTWHGPRKNYMKYGNDKSSCHSDEYE